MKNNTPPEIQPEPNSTEATLTLAQHIERISQAMEALASSGLNEKAIVTLIADSTKISKRNVRAVLDSMRELQENFVCRPKN